MNTYDFEDQRQALAVLDKKQNATWFAKTTQPSFSKPVKKRFEEMTIEELKDELWQARQTLEIQAQHHKAIPHAGLNEHIHKTSHRITILVRYIRKFEPDFELGESNNEWKTRYHRMEASLRAQIKELKVKLNMAKDESLKLKQQVESKREQEKLKRIEISNNREVEIHRYFKNIVRENVGDIEYMSMIKIASEMADSE